MKNKKELALETQQLVDRLVGVLSSQRKLGGDSYPLSLGKLVKLAEVDITAVSDCAKGKLFKGKITSARQIDKKKPDHDIPVALGEDVEKLATSPLTLEYMLKFKGTATIRAFSVTELGEKLTASKNVRGLFKGYMSKQIKQGLSGSDKVAWISCRVPKLFLLDDMHPEKLLSSRDTQPSAQTEPLVSTGHGEKKPAVTSTADLSRFPQSFDSAFNRLDRAEGGNNFVSLVDLRRELGAFDRETLDQNLQNLRRDGRYALIAAQGRSGGLSSEEMEAAINEAGKLLLYVSRI